MRLLNIFNIFRQATIYLDRQLVARDVDVNKYDSIRNTCKKATALLKQHHYQIIIEKNKGTIPDILINLEAALKKEEANSKVNKMSVNEANEENSDGNSQSANTVQPTIALKIMKLMGWKGNGLGAKEQGIQEPVEYT